MNFFDKIKQPFKSRKLKKGQLEEIRKILWDSVADGRIDETELERINSFFSQSELTTEEFNQARSDVFTQIVYEAMRDRRVTDSEYDSLEQIADHFNLPTELKKWTREKIAYFRLFSEIESGGDLPAGNPSDLILQKGELCHLSVPASLSEERVIRSSYKGGSHGVSIRIAKGLSYRVGQQRGHLESERGLVVVSEGYFIATNQRLVFSGNKKSVSSPFAKLLDFQVYSNAIQYSVTNRQKPITVGFSNPEDAELSALVVSRLINA